MGLCLNIKEIWSPKFNVFHWLNFFSSKTYYFFQQGISVTSSGVASHDLETRFFFQECQTSDVSNDDDSKSLRLALQGQDNTLHGQVSLALMWPGVHFIKVFAFNVYESTPVHVWRTRTRQYSTWSSKLALMRSGVNFIKLKCQFRHFKHQNMGVLNDSFLGT